MRVLNLSNSKGQSISEFIVTMAVLVPLLLTLASFANLLTLSTETKEAGRLAAWERTVYNDDVLTDSQIQNKIASNIREVYLDKNYSDFGPGKQLNAGALPSIVDRTGNGGQPVSVNLNPDANIAGTSMVNEDSRLVSRLGFANASDAVMQSPEISIAVNEDYSLLKLVSFNNFRESVYQDQATPEDQIAGRSQFNISSRSALIAAGWMPGSEQDLQDVTSQAAFDETGLRTYQGAGNFVFDLLGFEEAGLARQEGGYNTSAVNAGSIIPSDL